MNHFDFNLDDPVQAQALEGAMRARPFPGGDFECTYCQGAGVFFWRVDETGQPCTETGKEPVAIRSQECCDCHGSGSY